MHVFIDSLVDSLIVRHHSLKCLNKLQTNSWYFIIYYNNIHIVSCRDNNTFLNRFSVMSVCRRILNRFVQANAFAYVINTNPAFTRSRKKEAYNGLLSFVISASKNAILEENIAKTYLSKSLM